MNNLTRTTLLLLVFVLQSFIARSQIIDSEITLEQALKGSSAPDSILNRLAIVDVQYYSTDNEIHKGQIVVDSTLVSDVIEIFDYMKKAKYPIDMVIPIKFDQPNDGTSMSGLNNSYCFHYRKKVNNNSLSLHALGCAIDINPFNNPYISSTGDVIPKGTTYDIKDVKTLTESNLVVQKFKSLNWTWGGDWISIKDYMHFQKIVK